MSPSQTARSNGDIEQYNQIADTIMSTRNIPIIDLYGFTQNLGSDIYLNNVDTVHFTEHAAQLQASYIAGAVTIYIRRI